MYPPGPRLPPILQTIRYVQARERFMTANTRRYGDTFTLHMVAPYARNLVVFTRPEHVREIFAAAPPISTPGRATASCARCWAITRC